MKLENIKIMKAIRKDIKLQIEVRKMTKDEIYQDGNNYYCDDESGSIFKAQELNFNKCILCGKNEQYDSDGLCIVCNYNKMLNKNYV